MGQIYTSKLDDLFSSHAKIIKLIDESVKNLNILDVGCASGYLAKILSEKGHKIYGIELEEESANKASKFCEKVFVGDIENTKFELKNNFFDFVICGDVLEHLKDPLKALIKLKKYVKKTGFVIISTGNIANIYIRLNLLLGKFDYQDRGILDKTHCKLFTLKTLKKLVKDADLKLIKVLVSPIPLPILFPSMARGRFLYLIHIINYFITLLWKKLFAYQFIIKVQNE